MKRHAKKSTPLQKIFLVVDVGIILIGLVALYYLFMPDVQSTASSSSVESAESTSQRETETSSTVETSTSKESDTLDAANYENLIQNQEVVAPSGQTLDEKITSSGFIGSALIVQDGQILLHKGYGYTDKEINVLNTPDTVYNIGSIQKGMTAVLIMRAVKDGKLSLTDRLAKFYPQIQGAKDVTIQEMLQMASGLKLSAQPSGLVDVRQIIDWDVVHTQVTGAKGQFQYSPVNYNLLAGILIQVTGKTYDELFSTFYNQKMGLKQTLSYTDFFQLPTPTRNYKTDGKEDAYETPNIISSDNLASEIGTGNIYMSVGDLYQYYHLLLNNKLIDGASLKKMWTTAEGSSYAAGFYDRGTYYRAHGAKGGFESFALLSKDKKTSIILLSNRARKSDADLMSQLYKTLTNTEIKF